MIFKEDDKIKIGSISFHIQYEGIGEYMCVGEGIHNILWASGATLIAMGATKIENEPGLKSGAALEIHDMSYNEIMQSGFDKLRKEWEKDLAAEALAIASQWPMTKDPDIAKVLYDPLDSNYKREYIDRTALEVLFPKRQAVCECGTASVGGTKHSTWCPIKD